MTRFRLLPWLAVSLWAAVLILTPAPASAGLHPGMSFDEFKAVWEAEGHTPEGAVKCLLVAVLETVKEGNPDGLRMWGLVLPKDELNGDGEPDATHRFALEQFGKTVKGTSFAGGIAASYLGGTNQNGYAYSYESAVRVDTRQTRREEDKVKLFVRSGGKDNPSPVQLRKNATGYWKIFEYSSLYTGVKPIESNDF